MVDSLLLLISIVEDDFRFSVKWNIPVIKRPLQIGDFHGYGDRRQKPPPTRRLQRDILLSEKHKIIDKSTEIVSFVVKYSRLTNTIQA